MDVRTGDEPRKTLLIVEDDILPAMALRDELEAAGYNVLDLTGRHKEALAAAGRSLPDLALVNIELEGRDDGIALAEDLKALGIPVLLISGQVSRIQSAKTVAVASLPKPYNAADMVLAVDYLLGVRSGETRRSPPPGLQVFDRTAEGSDAAPA